MNYFRCTVGGSGKGNTVTVTCAEEFAGLTITLSKTGKTYTKTCPSTSPYVVTFNGVENGTYTVSCTVDGQTYSETVIVQDISCVLNYGFNWKLWVDTASQLDSSDYDSLDEVLADEEALRELFLEHACVDYMASVVASNEDLETVINDDYCAKWINNSDYALDYLYANEIIADLMDEADKYFYGEWVITDSTTTPPTWGPKGNVPVMTSNTAPYGEASGNSWDDHPPYYAFNENNKTAWISATNTYSRLVYKFTNPVCVKRFVASIKAARENLGITGYIQGSNDGSNWESLYTLNASDNTVDGIDIYNNNYYLYYCLLPSSYNYTEQSYNGVRVDKLQFYGRELKVSVPTMTSNTAPYGAAIGSAPLSGRSLYYAFDNDSSTAYASNTTDTSSQLFIGYNFVTPMCVKYVTGRIGTNTSTAHTSTYTIQASNDNSVWTDLLDNPFVVNHSGSGYTIDLSIDNDNCYSYYRLVRVSSSIDDKLVANSIQFFGLDYSEKEFEVGTTRKWLYDHGVKLENLEIIKGSSTTSPVSLNERNQIYIDKVVGTNANLNNFVCVGTTVDLSSYSLSRVTMGDKNTVGTSGTNSSHIDVWSTKPTNGGSYVDANRQSYKSIDIPIPAPNEIGLDISSINASRYISIDCLYYTNKTCSVKEWWLE